MLLMCQLSAHLYAEGPPLYCSQFDRKTHTIVPIQHVDVSTVSLSVCRRFTFEMLPLCFIYEESIPIRGVQNINMSKFCLADYLNPFSLLSCSQKYQNFLFRIMGSASSGIGYFGQKLSFWRYFGYFQFSWPKFYIFISNYINESD